MPRLIVIKGTDEGKQFDLTAGVVSIGRDRSNTIALHDTEVSRRHLELRQNEGGYRLVDLGSVNGTLVNTKPAQDQALSPGDHVQIGQTILVYSNVRADRPADATIASQIRLTASRHDLELPSAIVKTIGENEGSAILARPDRVNTAWLKTRLANLGVMYETIQAVSHILDVDDLLARIMELIFASIEADHGCFMLRDAETGELVPKTVRVRNPVLIQEKIVISRTIVDHVLREKQGILVSDASKDERFSAGQSIVRFHLREVICVPMKGRHETLGVLFLDTTTSSVRDLVRTGSDSKFTEDHLSLAIAIAHQAALAVEETRYHHALIQAERMAAIGHTIAALSHHIKNIMQGVVFGSELLNQGLGEDNKALILQGWSKIQRNQAKINELVLDMLSFSKEREPSLEPTDINQVVEDVVDVVRGRAADRGTALRLSVSPTLPRVPVDPDGLHRAVLNIVSNALDAVEGRAEALVTVQTLLEAGGEWAKVVVMDNGPGIEPERRDEVFKPFVSSKGSRGTGLGLAVSRKIVREHGGDILLETEVNVGSKFVIRLPLRSPSAPDSASGNIPMAQIVTRPPE